jgi:hypothetical protein
MALRTGHGNGAGVPRIEVLPADEQPAGIPAPSEPVAPPVSADLGRSNGRIADRQLAVELGRRGGQARAAKAAELKALTGLGLLGATPDVLRPYLDAANEFASSEVQRLARECGGGVCPQNAALTLGPTVASLLAAQQHSRAAAACPRGLHGPAAGSTQRSLGAHRVGTTGGRVAVFLNSVEDPQ